MKNKEFKTVLIALDYVPKAQLIAETGYAFAKSMNAKVTLLHVTVSQEMYSRYYSNMGTWQIDMVETVDLLKKNKIGSDNFLRKAKVHLADDTIQTIQKEGNDALMILETAKEINADCIVMGSHSHSWLEDIVMGSVTEEVMRKTTIPLFIIPLKE